MTRRLFMSSRRRRRRQRREKTLMHIRRTTTQPQISFCDVKNLRDRTRIWIKCPCFERALAFAVLCIALLCEPRFLLSPLSRDYRRCLTCDNGSRKSSQQRLLYDGKIKYLSLSRLYVLVSFVIGAHIHYVNESPYGEQRLQPHIESETALSGKKSFASRRHRIDDHIEFSRVRWLNVFKVARWLARRRLNGVNVIAMKSLALSLAHSTQPASPQIIAKQVPPFITDRDNVSRNVFNLYLNSFSSETVIITSDVLSVVGYQFCFFFPRYGASLIRKFDKKLALVGGGRREIIALLYSTHFWFLFPSTYCVYLL